MVSKKTESVQGKTVISQQLWILLPTRRRGATVGHVRETVVQMAHKGRCVDGEWNEDISSATCVPAIQSVHPNCFNCSTGFN